MNDCREERRILFQTFKHSNTSNNRPTLAHFLDDLYDPSLDACTSIQAIRDRCLAHLGPRLLNDMRQNYISHSTAVVATVSFGEIAEEIVEQLIFD